MKDICISCREPLSYPSGDGCAAMTKHQPINREIRDLDETERKRSQERAKKNGK